MSSSPRQIDLFGTSALGLDEAFVRARRTELPSTSRDPADRAWIEHTPAWLTGHEALFEAVRGAASWRSEIRQMYNREIETPRLLATAEDLSTWPPILERARRLLSKRYGEDFPRVSFALYRDGHDSVAMHGDTTARDLPQALVATLSLGAPRRMRLKPALGGTSIALTLGGGDLFVMGGSAQRTWRHAIPKAAHAAPRIVVMFRPVWTKP